MVIDHWNLDEGTDESEYLPPRPRRRRNQNSRNIENDQNDGKENDSKENDAKENDSKQTDAKQKDGGEKTEREAQRQIGAGPCGYSKGTKDVGAVLGGSPENRPARSVSPAGGRLSRGPPRINVLRCFDLT